MNVISIVFGIIFLIGAIAFCVRTILKLIDEQKERREYKRQKLENVDLSQQAGSATTVSADDNTPSDDINNNSEVKEK